MVCRVTCDAISRSKGQRLRSPGNVKIVFYRKGIFYRRCHCLFYRGSSVLWSVRRLSPMFRLLSAWNATINKQLNLYNLQKLVVYWVLTVKAMTFVSIRPDQRSLVLITVSRSYTIHPARSSVYFPTQLAYINYRSPINGQRPGKRLLATVRRLREQMVDFLGADVVCGGKISGQVTVLSSQPTGGLSPAFREAINYTESVPATIKWTDAEVASILSALLYAILINQLTCRNGSALPRRLQ